MQLEYICNHLIRSTHTVIRHYDNSGQLVQYYGGDKLIDPVFCDNNFGNELLNQAKEEYPVIILEKHPMYYSVIKDIHGIFIIGPVSIEYCTTFDNRKNIGEYIANVHKTGEKSHRVSFCEYVTFCEEVLLLFNFLKDKGMTYQELNANNFMTDELFYDMQSEIGKLYFEYQENEKVHNPYDREVAISLICSHPGSRAFLATYLTFSDPVNAFSIPILFSTYSIPSLLIVISFTNIA